MKASLNNRKIFYDEELNDKFVQNGYVVIPFFSEVEVNKANDIFEQHALKSDKAFYLSIWNNDVPSRMTVHNLLKPLIEQKSEDILIDYKFLISCFAVKMNSELSAWELHQDDSFTDETRFESLSIWVALSDVDAGNGAMRVLEDSHKEYTGPRAPTIPKLFAMDDKSLNARMKTVNMKAGEALFFNHRLLHDSCANNADKPRIAAVSVLIPKEAPIWFYYNENDTVTTITLDDDYYLKFKLGERPHGVVEKLEPLAELISNRLPNNNQ